MSDVLASAVTTLNERLNGGGIDGSIRLTIEDEGAVRIDENGARTEDTDADADCTLTASAETFRSILDGDLDPTAAFMSGRLAVEGEMGLALKLGSLLG